MHPIADYNIVFNRAVCIDNYALTDGCSAVDHRPVHYHGALAGYGALIENGVRRGDQRKLQRQRTESHPQLMPLCSRIELTHAEHRVQYFSVCRQRIQLGVRSKISCSQNVSVVFQIGIAQEPVGWELSKEAD